MILWEQVKCSKIQTGTAIHIALFVVTGLVLVRSSLHVLQDHVQGVARFLAFASQNHALYVVIYHVHVQSHQKNLIEIKLLNGRRLSLETTWEQKIFFGDEFISLGEYIEKLFGKIPSFFSGANDLKTKWANPETREELLRTLDEAGFAEDKLMLLKNMLKMQKCDLLDVLEYIAYDSTPIERAKRVELVKKQYVNSLSKEQQEFDNLILQYYANNGFKELSTDSLTTYIKIKFNSMSDAKDKMQMSASDIRNHYIELQRKLYCA